MNHTGSNTMWNVHLWIAPGLNRAFIAGANSTNDDTFWMLDGIIGSLINHQDVDPVYTDAGATASDALDGDLTDKLAVDNPVDIGKPAVYTVTYTVTDSNDNTATATRKVTVVDTTAPALALSGEAEVIVEAGSAYSDSGATAFDTVEGDLSSEIVAVSTVDTSTPGVYAVTYNVSDSDGNEATEFSR